MANFCEVLASPCGRSETIRGLFSYILFVTSARVFWPFCVDNDSCEGGNSDTLRCCEGF